MTTPRLIAITIIRNEEHNFLGDWLNNIASIADYHIFIDDASTDNTADIVAQHLRKHSGELHRRKTSLFRDNEPALRDRLWKYTRHVARPGDWILIVDADEFYDGHMMRIKKKLLANKYPNACVLTVSCLDMWNARQYRTDGHWSPKYSDIRLIRFCDTPFGATSSALHQAPYPSSIDTSKKVKRFIPKIHLAYLRKRDKERRYKFYTQNVSKETDPVSYEHAQSIMSRHVKLSPYFCWRHTLHAICVCDWRYFQIKHITNKYKDKK